MNADAIGQRALQQGMMAPSDNRHHQAGRSRRPSVD
jgi:hypothetical protein